MGVLLTDSSILLLLSTVDSFVSLVIQGVCTPELEWLWPKGSQAGREEVEEEEDDEEEEVELEVTWLYASLLKAKIDR